MHSDYSDIIARAGKPDWWDENGTPRYGEFHWRRCPDIYADFVVFAMIRCASCGRTFKVQMSDRKLSMSRLFAKHEWTPEGLPDFPHGHLGGWCYGDPPWHTERDSGQCAGTTETSDEVAILQFWGIDPDTHEMKRMPQYEGLWEQDNES